MSYSIIDHDGFDGSATGDLALEWPSGSLGTGGTACQVTANGRNSGNCFDNVDAGTDGHLRRLFPNAQTISEFALGFALYPVTVPVAGVLCGVLEGATEHLMLGITTGSGGSARSLQVRRGGTVIATLTDVVVTGAYQHIVFAGKIHDTTGYWRVWVEGVLVGSADNVDTRNAGTTGLADRWQLGTSISLSSSYRIRIDDAYIASVTSGPENPGDLRESVLIPDAAGNYTQWTPSAGSNYQNVDELDSDGDTTYNASTTVGNRDSFGLPNLPVTPTDIYSVRQLVEARKDDVGARTLRQFVRISGTDYEGGNLVLTSSYAVQHVQNPTSPASSAAWTASEVNALEAGYKDQA